MSELARLFAEDGPLAEQVENYSPRPEQLGMAEAVARALERNETLLVEAGTGTGKTFAYLVPALLSRRQIVISTGTRTLQDQLFHRDLPVVAGALGRPGRVALLKGRANYLCLYRLKQAELDPKLSKTQGRQLSHVRRWAEQTNSGDVSEVSTVPEQAAIWPRVTSTAENCLGQSCEFFDQCHVVKARREAQAADTVVVNHHLLMADLTLKEAGFGELLPGADALIIDEAHQLPDTAARFFGVSLSSRRLAELARDLLVESAPLENASEVRKRVERLELAVKKLRLALGPGNGRRRLDEAGEAAGTGMQQLAAALQACDELLASISPTENKGLESCRGRISLCQQELAQLSDDDPEPGLRWIEVAKQHFTVHLTPFNVAKELQGLMAARDSAWIFTSATLAVGDDFEHFGQRVGVVDAVNLRLESPFDFSGQARLWLPEDLPEPASRNYTSRVVAEARPLIAAAGGRAFLLFTSHRALEEAASLLADSLDFPLLVQGHAPREDLLARFRRLGNAVLMGTSSFWQGVDVRGPALSLVIIDKLPFASPGDPLQQARIEAIRQQGGNPFSEFQLPQAVLALKQGVGRLIRDYNDHGVAVICDPRIRSKAYGRLFLRSLPPMARAKSLQDACEFLRDRRAAETKAIA